jgi:hypothetical protein
MSLVAEIGFSTMDSAGPTVSADCGVANANSKQSPELELESDENPTEENSSDDDKLESDELIELMDI